MVEINNDEEVKIFLILIILVIVSVFGIVFYQRHLYNSVVCEPQVHILKSVDWDVGERIITTLTFEDGLVLNFNKRIEKALYLGKAMVINKCVRKEGEIDWRID